MDFKVAGNLVPSVLVTMDMNEHVFSEGGLLVYKDVSVHTSYTTLSKVTGSVTGAIVRSTLAKIPFYLLTYSGPGSCAFSRSTVGEVRIAELKEGETLDIAENSIICAESSVKYDYFYVHGTTRVGRMIGFFMDKLTGPGKVAYHGHGTILSFNLAEGESMSIDYGAILSKESSVTIKTYNIPYGGGLLGHAMSFEAIEVTGPGKIEIETKDPKAKTL
ncbi:MAG: AIM24 family protein [Candidatus Thermoplasmatota archaeon]|nr:AIM24 family protein [Candidatus Thermoplasmatota archaeon]MCL5963351.1 AIM24 family protein [Candidatus Thermoplasmatota archaeon]